MKHHFKVPAHVVRREIPRAPDDSAYSYGRRAEEHIVERCKEGGMDDVIAAARMPDGTVRVWGEAGASRPPTDREKYEQGWERAFGKKA